MTIKTRIALPCYAGAGKFFFGKRNSLSKITHYIFDRDFYGGVPVVVDVELVEAAKRGDKQSFAQVYDMIAPDLYKVALYTLGNAHDAEDAVSETFFEAYKGIAGIRDTASFKAWMMKILSIRCKRKIAEYVKNKNRLDIEDFIGTIADESDISAEVSEQATVVQALARLSEQERLIIGLSVLEGYTTKEIAKITGNPQGTISSKLHRALAKLRKMLEGSIEIRG